MKKFGGFAVCRSYWPRRSGTPLASYVARFPLGLPPPINPYHIEPAAGRRKATSYLPLFFIQPTKLDLRLQSAFATYSRILQQNKHLSDRSLCCVPALHIECPTSARVHCPISTRKHAPSEVHFLHASLLRKHAQESGFQAKTDWSPIFHKVIFPSGISEIESPVCDCMMTPS